jgi:D-xylose transport system permease protein
MTSTENPTPPTAGKGTGTATEVPLAPLPAPSVALDANAELTANTFGEYMRAWVGRVRGGDAGILPVIGGLIVIVIIFQSQKSVFLSAANLTNLLVQGAVFMTLGMAEVFVLLLGEIDLSIGYGGAIGAVVTVATAAPPGNHPWWIAILFGLAVTSALGFLQGNLITRLRVPSFVVTLAGLLGFEGLLILLCNREGGKNGGGTVEITNSILKDLVNGTLSVTAGWVLLVVVVAVFAAFNLIRDQQRRAHGLVAPPLALTIIRIVLVAAAGFALVAICNTNRGRLKTHPVQGVPWVVLIVLGVLGIWTLLLSRTRFGRYVYAVGGNAEAARRAGISLKRIRVACFTLCGLTAGIGGILYASQLGSISSDVDGGQLVLYAVAAAVIGGTSLFGGRGKMLHAVLGGLVIATIYNGMGLIGLSAPSQFIVTALVLLAAASVDALARRSTTRT